MVDGGHLHVREKEYTRKLPNNSLKINDPISG